MDDGTVNARTIAGNEVALSPIAHSKNQRGQRHDLVKHLTSVAELAGKFGSKFGARDIAYFVGLTHDLGKFHRDFQDYLYRCELDPDRHGRGPDHKATGSSFAAQKAWFLAMIVSGHHGGLQDKDGEFRVWLAERQREVGGDGRKRWEAALSIARSYLPGLDAARDAALAEYKGLQADWNGPTAKRQLELLIRMVFSCLVDADFLDTERHFDLGRLGQRTIESKLSDLWPPFEAHHARLQCASPAAPFVTKVRAEVYQACLQAADRQPGFFRLTVPTGGGKTLSGLAFGIRHAQRHGLNRVIFAVPYTSICEQTTRVYRGIFDDDRVVLEHHSAANIRDSESPSSAQDMWGRLAAENWDAPVIVTTTVQLFESLLAKNTRRCRKLHNIARGVIVLDEAQTLPSHLLDSILDVLIELVRAYGVTVVFCTATQPDLAAALGSISLPDVTEIVPQHVRHFAELKRVDYEKPAGRWSWQQVAEEMAGANQALAILNTRKAAQHVGLALQQKGITPFHLSTQLCGQHRAAVLEEVRNKLETGKGCQLVATQVVEAGVDLDFPLVLRAMGPLDRIAQAAGRCNRNGRLAWGRVVVFEPEDHRLPPGDYRIGSDVAEVLWQERQIDLDDPSTFLTYFSRFYGKLDLDRQRIQAHRESWAFHKVAQLARVIEDETFPVVVPYGDYAEAVELLASDSFSPRMAWRRSQPFLVSLRGYEFDRASKAGLLRAVRRDLELYLWEGPYDQTYGLDLMAIRGLSSERLDERPDWS